ncbi:MAG: RNA pyrophosphohydrolase [Sphingomonadales bacterium]|nr:RNA pyrophosphohydrolase [Sphingomonadales bacterium]
MNDAEIDLLPYRPCVGVALFNPLGQVFVGQRIDTTQEAWQMPQGGIDPGEDPVAAAFRELQEEIGTAAAEVIEDIPEWLTYDLPPELLGKVWRGRYRGQTQKWYAMRFLGEDADINLETHHPEFHSWRWMRLSELPAQIVPFKRGIYEEVARRFAHLAT